MGRLKGAGRGDKAGNGLGNEREARREIQRKRRRDGRRCACGSALSEGKQWLQFPHLLSVNTVTGIEGVNHYFTLCLHLSSEKFGNSSEIIS